MRPAAVPPASIDVHAHCVPVGVMRFVVRDGLVAHRIDYWDSLVFQRQAGLV